MLRMESFEISLEILKIFVLSAPNRLVLAVISEVLSRPSHNFVDFNQIVLLVRLLLRGEIFFQSRVALACRSFTEFFSRASNLNFINSKRKNIFL